MGSQSKNSKACPDDNKLAPMSMFIPESNKDEAKREEIHTEVQPALQLPDIE